MLTVIFGAGASYDLLSRGKLDADVMKKIN